VRIITSTMRKSLGNVPLILKMGYLADDNLVLEVMREAVQNGASALSAINTIPAKVLTADGQQALPGEGRLTSGICGATIKPAGLAMARKLLDARSILGLKPEDLTLIGVGGVMTATDALEYLNLGLDGVQSGTGAMWNPALAAEFKQLYSKREATVSAR